MQISLQISMGLVPMIRGDHGHALGHDRTCAGVSFVHGFVRML